MKVANRTFVISGGSVMFCGFFTPLRMLTRPTWDRSSGLGLATAEDLLQAEAYVAVLDISPMPSSYSLQSRLLYIKMDITKVEQVESAVEQVAAWSKSTGAHIGGVINGAGIAMAEMVRTMPECLL